MIRWYCEECDYTYIPEMEGEVDFTDLPSNWQCPVCQSNKDRFYMESDTRLIMWDWFNELELQGPKMRYIVDAISTIFADIHDAVTFYKTIYHLKRQDIWLLDRLEKMFNIIYVNEDLPPHIRKFFILNNNFFLKNKGDLECFAGLTYTFTNSVISIKNLWTDANYESFIEEQFIPSNIKDGGTYWPSPHVIVGITTPDSNANVVPERDLKDLDLYISQMSNNPSHIAVVNYRESFPEEIFYNRFEVIRNIYRLNDGPGEFLKFNVINLEESGFITIYGMSYEKKVITEELYIASEGDYKTVNKWYEIDKIIYTGKYYVGLKQTLMENLMWSLDELKATFGIYKPADMLIDAFSHNKFWIDEYLDEIVDYFGANIRKGEVDELRFDFRSIHHGEPFKFGEYNSPVDFVTLIGAWKAGPWGVSTTPRASYPGVIAGEEGQLIRKPVEVHFHQTANVQNEIFVTNIIEKDSNDPSIIPDIF